MTILGAAIFHAFVAWCPVSQHAYVESESSTITRYESIAETIAMVSSDPIVEPIFGGIDGRARTALLLAAIASMESGCFRRDITYCQASGDGGKAWGLWQSHWSKDRVCPSVSDAAHIAIMQVRQSLRQCADRPVSEQLSAYASGSCLRGHRESRARWLRFDQWSRSDRWTVQP